MPATPPGPQSSLGCARVFKDDPQPFPTFTAQLVFFARPAASARPAGIGENGLRPSLLSLRRAPRTKNRLCGSHLLEQEVELTNEDVCLPGVVASRCRPAGRHHLPGQHTETPSECRCCPQTSFLGGACCVRSGVQVARREVMRSIHSLSGSSCNSAVATTPSRSACTRVRTLATSAGVRSAVSSASSSSPVAGLVEVLMAPVPARVCWSRIEACLIAVAPAWTSDQA